MTCVAGAATFRLLDAYIGWDPALVGGLTGLTDPDGLRLGRSGPDPDAPSRQDLLPWFPDPRLAPGHDRCAWYLATATGVRRRDPCGGTFIPAWPPVPQAALAVAAAGHWLAVARPGAVDLRWREGEQLVAVLPVEAPRVLALTPAGELYVVRAGGTDLVRYGPGGVPRGVLRTGLPGDLVGVRVDRNHRLWLLSEDGDGVHLWRSGVHDGDRRIATRAELAAAVPRSPLTATWEGGFCLGDTDPDGEPVDRCYDWTGTPVPGPPPAPATRYAEGELLTTAIDSGLPRCRWHRVSLDADVPAGTAVRVSIAVTEIRGAVPDAGDWQDAPPGATDFLVEQPPGRYLYLRLRLSGDGTATPVVRRLRLDFPRSTSADLLPAAFREDPAADDFTERFLSLFDMSLASIDRVIDRYPALLDAAGVPDGALPWLGGLLGLAFDADWDAATRRALLAAAPELFRRRGTPWAIQEAVRIVFGVTPVIEELAVRRGWLRLRERGRLGSARLFGRSAARFRVGTSALSTAPLRSFGDPHGDPLDVDAYRFRVVVPPAHTRPPEAAALRALVRAQAPAHTAASVRTGGHGWVVGMWSAVGVDTAFVAPPAPVLHPGNPGRGEPVRLGRYSVLAGSRIGPTRGVTVGSTAVGVQSVAW